MSSCQIGQSVVQDGARGLMLTGLHNLVLLNQLHARAVVVSTAEPIFSAWDSILHDISTGYFDGSRIAMKRSSPRLSISGLPAHAPIIGISCIQKQSVCIIEAEIEALMKTAKNQKYLSRTHCYGENDTQMDIAQFRGKGLRNMLTR